MATDKPTYTKHARQRMAERKISETEVERTLAEHHTKYTDKAGNQILLADVDGRRIRVVVAKGSQPPRIITTADSDGGTGWRSS